MDIDWGHTGATIAIVFVVVLLLDRFGVLEGASRGKRFIITALAIFVPIFILNMFWPYGAS